MSQLTQKDFRNRITKLASTIFKFAQDKEDSEFYTSTRLPNPNDQLANPMESSLGAEELGVFRNWKDHKGKFFEIVGSFLEKKIFDTFSGLDDDVLNKIYDLSKVSKSSFFKAYKTNKDMSAGTFVNDIFSSGQIPGNEDDSAQQAAEIMKELYDKVSGLLAACMWDLTATKMRSRLKTSVDIDTETLTYKTKRFVMSAVENYFNNQPVAREFNSMVEGVVQSSVNTQPYSVKQSHTGNLYLNIGYMLEGLKSLSDDDFESPENLKQKLQSATPNKKQQYAFERTNRAVNVLDKFKSIGYKKEKLQDLMRVWEDLNKKGSIEPEQQQDMKLLYNMYSIWMQEKQREILGYSFKELLDEHDLPLIYFRPKRDATGKIDNVGTEKGIRKGLSAKLLIGLLKKKLASGEIDDVAAAKDAIVLLEEKERGMDELSYKITVKERDRDSELLKAQQSGGTIDFPTIREKFNKEIEVLESEMDTDSKILEKAVESIKDSNLVNFKDSLGKIFNFKDKDVDKKLAFMLYPENTRDMVDLVHVNNYLASRGAVDPTSLEELQKTRDDEDSSAVRDIADTNETTQPESSYVGQESFREMIDAVREQLRSQSGGSEVTKKEIIQNIDNYIENNFDASKIPQDLIREFHTHIDRTLDDLKVGTNDNKVYENIKNYMSQFFNVAKKFSTKSNDTDYSDNSDNEELMNSIQEVMKKTDDPVNVLNEAKEFAKNYQKRFRAQSPESNLWNKDKMNELKVKLENSKKQSLDVSQKSRLAFLTRKKDALDREIAKYQFSIQELQDKLSNSGMTESQQEYMANEVDVLYGDLLTYLDYKNTVLEDWMSDFPTLMDDPEKQKGLEEQEQQWLERERFRVVEQIRQNQTKIMKWEQLTKDPTVNMADDDIRKLEDKIEQNNRVLSKVLDIHKKVVKSMELINKNRSVVSKAYQAEMQEMQEMLDKSIPEAHSQEYNKKMNEFIERFAMSNIYQYYVKAILYPYLQNPKLVEQDFNDLSKGGRGGISLENIKSQAEFLAQNLYEHINSSFASISDSKRVTTKEQVQDLITNGINKLLTTQLSLKPVDSSDLFDVKENSEPEQDSPSVRKQLFNTFNQLNNKDKSNKVAGKLKESIISSSAKGEKGSSLKETERFAALVGGVMSSVFNEHVENMEKATSGSEYSDIVDKALNETKERLMHALSDDAKARNTTFDKDIFDTKWEEAVNENIKSVSSRFRVTPGGPLDVGNIEMTRGVPFNQIVKGRDIDDGNDASFPLLYKKPAPRVRKSKDSELKDIQAQFTNLGNRIMKYGASEVNRIHREYKLAMIFGVYK